MMRDCRVFLLVLTLMSVTSTRSSYLIKRLVAEVTHSPGELTSAIDHEPLAQTMDSIESAVILPRKDDYSLARHKALPPFVDELINPKIEKGNFWALLHRMGFLSKTLGVGGWNRQWNTELADMVNENEKYSIWYIIPRLSGKAEEISKSRITIVEKLSGLLEHDSQLARTALHWRKKRLQSAEKEKPNSADMEISKTTAIEQTQPAAQEEKSLTKSWLAERIGRSPHEAKLIISELLGYELSSRMAGASLERPSVPEDLATSARETEYEAAYKRLAGLKDKIGALDERKKETPNTPQTKLEDVSYGISDLVESLIRLADDLVEHSSGLADHLKSLDQKSMEKEFSVEKISKLLNLREELEVELEHIQETKIPWARMIKYHGGILDEKTGLRKFYKDYENRIQELKEAEDDLLHERRFGQGLNASFRRKLKKPESSVPGAAAGVEAT